ncbi:MAG: hypothetical protein QXU18_10440 [Thermoplasmatales archaeon]
MDRGILEVAKRIGKELSISIEVKKSGNSSYLHLSTTRWDEEKG